MAYIFKIFEPCPFDKTFSSHKFKCAGLTYEIGLNFHPGDIFWAFSGYPVGTPDITLARRRILSVFLAGEFIIADKGYYGERDQIITPINDYTTNFNYQNT